jgi:four helix bundle protein
MSFEFNFEKLNVYKRSLGFSIELCKKASDFPIKFSRLRDQLIGAAISVPLNIAEGSGRKTDKDKIHFYKIARASVFECVPILDICSQLSLVEEDFYNKFKQEITEISKMLSGLINSIH